MHDGATVAWSGFSAFNRNPSAWAWETVRQGFKKIHSIDRHGSFCTWLLNAVGAQSIHESDWDGWAEMAGKLDVNHIRQFKDGELMLEEYTHGAMQMRFLAGALGIPFIPYYAGIGSDLYNPEYDTLGRAKMRGGDNPRIARKKFDSMQDPFYNEGTIMLLPAARPEIGVLHVPQVGEKGTARWRGIGTMDKEMIFACDKVILTCEEIVPESELRRNPESNQVPYFVVDCIVEVPWGGYPSSVPFYYDYDADFMRKGDAASKNVDDLKKWLDEWVFGPKDWREVMKKVGTEKMMDLKADELTGYSRKIKRGQNPPPMMSMPVSVKRVGF
jgi:glutaconate CoA-transferase subunit A